MLNPLLLFVLCPGADRKVSKVYYYKKTFIFGGEAEWTRDCGGGLGSTCWLAFILAHDVRS